MSTYVEASRILSVVTSIGLVYSLYAQGFKIWRRRSAADIHMAIAVVPLINEIAWLNYGFAIREWPILVICGVNLGACLLITTGYFKYRKRRFDPGVVEEGLGI